MKSLVKAWKSFWFAPSQPTNLGLCRSLFFGLALLLFWNYSFRSWAEIPQAFWIPIFFFETLDLPILSHSALGVLEKIWKVALALSCIGLFTRPSVLISLLLGIYLLGIPHNFGKTNHGDALVVLIMGILSLSRCADAWSFDRLIRSIRAAGIQDDASRPSGECTWPVRLIWVLMTLVFFGAGISKLRHSGLEWITSSNLTFTLIRHHYTHEPVVDWGLWMAQHGWLTRLAAGLTIAAEIGSPLALFGRYPRFLFISTLFLMQVGIWLLMGVRFQAFMIAYVFWLPWERLGQSLAGALRPKRLYSPVVRG